MKKKLRHIIYNKTNGKCGYCGEILPEKWHIDHIKPLRRGCATFDSKEKLEHIDNKIASCPSCNINKHSMEVDQFRYFIMNFIRSLNRDSTQYKMAKKYGLIKEELKEIKFYFEKLQEE